MENTFIKKIFEKEMTEKLFSAYQSGTIDDRFFLKKYCAGTLSFENIEPVTDETLFDLASLTKVLLTAPLFYTLFYEKVISKNDPVCKFLPEFDTSITIIELLGHTSGLQAWLPFYELADNRLGIEQRKNEVVDIINKSDRLKKTYLYSDLNFILLGFILERIYGQRLDKIFNDFKKKNGLIENIVFFPQTPTPFTAFSKLRNSFPDRTVEDENCYFLGGLTGHAGLFASAENTLKYVRGLLEKEWFMETGSKLHFAGFDRPSGTDSNYGKKAENSFIGHLGFTGTALLINPLSRKVSVLFTNSTHPSPGKPDRKERLKKCRQLFFDSSI
ncbi:MAG TPA: serine hydrolase domain-containing protein [bacterium]|nr:serine hydrolase domain-containing protein [bacterium]